MPYDCQYIKQSLHFHYKEIRSCCSDAQGPIFVSNFEGQEVDWNKVADMRAEIQKDFKAGVIPECCANCFQLQSYNGENAIQDANQLFISHWRHCNCGCVYCDNRHETFGKFDQKPKKSEFYDLLPTLQNMINDGVITPQTLVTFLGGECTMLEEFDSIINLLDAYVERHINILSSGIKHNQSIENLFKKHKCGLTVSLDSGCAETYQKIKRVPYFFDVIENIKRYRDSCPNAKNHIHLKYILLQGLNDNIKELEKFILLAKEMEIPNIQLDVDHNTYNKKELPGHYNELYSYFIDKSDQLGLNLDVSEQNSSFLKKCNFTLNK